MTEASSNQQVSVGFTCAYAPVPLFMAAGFNPYRVLPVSEAADQAGTVLHDNMCPHVKRVLDRAMEGDVPELAGMVIVNSCDTMRRLADAWRQARPGEPVALLDLPVVDDEAGVDYLALELKKLGATLSEWSGREVSGTGLLEALGPFNDLARGLGELGGRVASGATDMDRADLQALMNRSVTQPIQLSLEEIRRGLSGEAGHSDGRGQPVFLFGNVLPDPEGFKLLADCGARVVGDDLCTGDKQLLPLQIADGEDPWKGLARGILSRTRCARTISPERPGIMGEELVDRATRNGARGVVAHVMKFCDPYLARMPAVRRSLESAGLPLLVLEGDCTTRSLGQQRTRIEAFVEMLGDAA